MDIYIYICDYSRARARPVCICGDVRGVLQSNAWCVAVCCSVLQCVAVCRAVYCSVLQCVAHCVYVVMCVCV